MNFVFQALVIFAFALPGVVFSSAYNIGRKWSFPVGRLGAFTERVPKTLIHAAWLNCLWACIVSSFSLIVPNLVWSIDFDSVVCWLSNTFGNNQSHFDRALKSLTASPVRVFLYFAFLYPFSWCMGYLFHEYIRGGKWDRLLRFFRFDNAWHYLLKGEVLDFSDQAYRRSSEDRPNLTTGNYQATIIAAGVEISGIAYLYIGVLIDFFFDSDGNLERVLLEGVNRRRLEDDARKAHKIEA